MEDKKHIHGPECVYLDINGYQTLVCGQDGYWPNGTFQAGYVKPAVGKTTLMVLGLLGVATVVLCMAIAL